MTFFDQEAANYDDWFKTPLGSHVEREETACVMSMTHFPAGSRILDVGCGSGNYSLQLARLGYQVVGIDISEEMLKLAREKAQKEGFDIRFEKQDVYALTFDSESFDGIFSMAAFEFIHEEKQAMDEMLRVLKPGGDLIIGTIHGDSAWGRLYMSEEVQANTVFKYAKFKSLEEMAALHPALLKEQAECLFVPPMAKEEELNPAGEASYRSRGERGGFICLRWQK